MNKYQPLSNKGLRIGLYTLLGILLIGLLLSIGGSYWVKEKIEKRLEGIEGLTYDSLDIDLMKGSLGLTALQFRKKISPTDSNFIAIDHLMIDGIHWWASWRKKEILIDRVWIKNLAASLNSSDSVVWKRPPSKDKRISGIQIQALDIDKAKIDFKTKDHSAVAIEDLQLNIQNLLWNEESGLSKKDLSRFEISTGALSWKPEKGFYYVSLEKLNGNAVTDLMTVTNFNLTPKYGKTEWSTKVDFRRPRLHLITKELQMKGFNCLEFLETRQLNMTELTVKDSWLEAFIDQSLPSCEACYRPLIHEQLLQAELPIDIATVLVKNTDIFIEVLCPGFTETGSISFEEVYATVSNVTNTPTSIAANSQIRADVLSNFMGEEKLDAQMTFSLNDPEYAYTFRGNMDDLNLSSFSQLMIPVNGASIKSGRLKHLDFQGEGNYQKSEGTMNFTYEDLQIKLMDKETKKDKKVLSFLANTLALRKENVMGDKNYREGIMYHERDSTKAIFYQWWMTVQSGFQSIMLNKALIKKELR